METAMENLAEWKQGKSGLNAAMPEVMKHLDGLFQVSQADGALSAKVKVLIGLGVGLAAHCEPCILVHLEKALAAGASRGKLRVTSQHSTNRPSNERAGWRDGLRGSAAVCATDRQGRQIAPETGRNRKTNVEC